MKKFEERVKLKPLKKLLGCKVKAIHSHAISCYDEYTQSSCFSIASSNKWVTFSNEWKETDNDIDYYSLNVELEKTPSNIKVEKNNFLSPVSSLYTNIESEIEKIEVYNRDEVWNDEQVVYDALLLFRSKDNNVFSIYIVESIADQIVYSKNKSLIEKEVSDCHLREVLES